MAEASQPYALGHSKDEMERLSRQAQLLAPFTRQVFQQAGISHGMRVLDVGCGAGDVAFLVAGLVGETGAVIGADRAGAAVQWATARAASLNIESVRFIEGDPTELQFDTAFDAIVGRLVLMYCPDPVLTLRKLAQKLRPGGLIAFQEVDFENARAFPPIPIFDRCVGWISKTFRATGARPRLGVELYSLFLDAGFTTASMRSDVLIGGGPDAEVYEMVSDIVRSLLPMMEKLNIATASEVRIETLSQRMRDEVVAGKAVVQSPAFIGAWSRSHAH